MESFASLIRQRRSTRKFTSELLTPEQVEAIMKAALMAPSSKQSTPWQFVLVEDKEMLQKLSETRQNGSTFLAGCALAVVVMAAPMVSDAWIEDASIAAIYMQLQAEDLGLGSCWCQIHGRQRPDDSEAQDYVRQLLDIPYQLEVLCIVGIGNKDQVRKPFDDAHLQWEKISMGKYQMPKNNDKEESKE